MDAPCLDCPDRVLGCHSVCEKYKAFREEKDRESEKRKLAIAGNTLTYREFTKKLKFKQRLRRGRNPRK